jgi:Holliday junction resolvasome RuvABC endonuclease subunit
MTYKYVIGFDPSKQNCGVAIFELYEELIQWGDNPYKLIYCNTLNIGSQKGMAELTRILQNRDDAVLFFENNPFNRGSQAKAEESDYYKQEALGQRIRRGQAETVGMLLGICSAFNIYPPHKKQTDARVAAMTAKKALTGTGKATKEMMIEWAYKRFPILKLEGITEHQADSIGVSLAGIQRIHAGFPKKIKKVKRVNK